MVLRIEDYALIGDCETAALVGRDGSIDWLCWPRFDGDACFAALLGTRENGHWKIAPKGEATVTRRYRDDTLILETHFETETGAVTLIDFMPPHDGLSNLVRIVVGERGRVDMRTDLSLRFGYGQQVPWMTRMDDGTRRAIAGPDMVVVRTPVALRGENMHSVGEFVVEAGQSVPFVMSHVPSYRPPPPYTDVAAALADTEAFWREWVARGVEGGPWTGQVVRSLITLKALTSATTGGIVAAPTTSLPEQIGGTRNWDYRYCWLRDATFTLLALMNAGYGEEARAWEDWLQRAVAGSADQLQIMYGIAGERRLAEWEVPWLSGYEGSLPVRIGNAAHDQLQLDVYGEVLDAMHQARGHGLMAGGEGWGLQCELLRRLETLWHEPDEGIWEVRGPRRHFVHSKVMAWVAFDRGVKSAERFGGEGPIDRWRRARDEIHAEVCEKGFDAELGSFVQAYGGQELDASLLLLPVVGFLPPDDPRIRGTVEAIEKRLVVNGFVMRYDTGKTEDGLPPGEGAFLACSFWLADAYVLLGRLDDATRLFERLLALCNDVGLLAEEYDPRLGRQVGNFPQAFSHIGLINTAHNIARATKPAEQRSK